MYHEALWVAVSAAAPVIALAAIVAVTDAVGALSRMLEWLAEHQPDPATITGHRSAEEAWSKARKKADDIRQYVGIILGLSLMNTGLQAFVLGFSLTSLASNTDEIPPFTVIIIEVAGLGWLTASALRAGSARLSMTSAIGSLRLGRPPSDGHDESPAQPG